MISLKKTKIFSLRYRVGNIVLYVDEKSFLDSDYSANVSQIAANGEQHRRLRRLLSHAFSDRALKAQETIVADYIDLFINQLRKRSGVEPVDMVMWFNFLTFDIIGDLAFGESFGLLKSGICHQYVTTIYGFIRGGLYFRATKRLFPSRLHGYIARLAAPKRVKTARAYQYNLAKEAIQKRMELGENAREDFSKFAPVFDYDAVAIPTKLEIKSPTFSMVRRSKLAKTA